MTTTYSFAYHTLGLIALCLLSFSCSRDLQSGGESAVDALMGTRSEAPSDLDKWIDENFTRPYGIEVIYTQREVEKPSGIYSYPPAETKVKPILESLLRL